MYCRFRSTGGKSASEVLNSDHYCGMCICVHHGYSACISLLCTCVPEQFQVAVVAVMVLAGGVFAYRYYNNNQASTQGFTDMDSAHVRSSTQSSHSVPLSLFSSSSMSPPIPSAGPTLQLGTQHVYA